MTDRDDAQQKAEEIAHRERVQAYEVAWMYLRNARRRDEQKAILSPEDLVWLQAGAPDDRTRSAFKNAALEAAAREADDYDDRDNYKARRCTHCASITSVRHLDARGRCDVCNR